MKLDLQKERESEMASVWGTETVGDRRFPKRKHLQKKSARMFYGADAADADVDDLISDTQSADADKGGSEKPHCKKATKKERSAIKKEWYRLHCFVAPGTNVNDVREVFEEYEPKVDIRTTCKGNLLNKVQYAVLTFRNKAMALHAVKTLDGTNQRELLGVHALKLGIMLSREQNKYLRRKAKKALEERRKHVKELELAEDEEFLRNVVAQHGHK
jgi:hypothetical protein